MSENGADGLLFASLLRAIQSDRGAAELHADSSSMVEDGVRQRIAEWWNTEPLWRVENAEPALTRERYERIYRALTDASSLETFGDEGNDIAKWIEVDWARDQRASSDLSAVIQFFTTFYRILNRTSAATVDLETLLTRISSSVCSAPSTEAAAVKKPTTMAEKLAQMRSKRSTIAKATSSSASDTVTDASTAAPPLEITLPYLSAASSSSSTATKSSSHDASASHFFSIETRVELHERLLALQRRLDSLLVQSKLAWMKCFASCVHDSDSAFATDLATRLVTQGESLAAHLQDAFARTKATGGSISEFKALVATCESEFQDMEAFVRSIASAPSPVKHEEGRTPNINPSEGDSSELQRRPPLAFDLPSMKSYYDRAAPSYAAYLPKKTSALNNYNSRRK